MEEINFIISENLKRLREEKKLSLEAVSKLCGVSKSMIGQIERNEVNPTVSTISKIIEGFGVTFADITSSTKFDYKTANVDSIMPVTECKKKYRSYPLFFLEKSSGNEVYYVEIDQGGTFTTDSREDGTIEYIMVFKGTLVLTASDKKIILSQGMSARYRANCKRTYTNKDSKTCKIYMVVNYR